MDRSLIARLPLPLPAERIIALNQPKVDLHTHRRYDWNGWEFDVPPGVFLPGATSRMIHQRLLDDDIDVRGRHYVAMGSGLGVEAVVAGLRGARTVHAVDVHPASVRATEDNYRRLVDGAADTATAFVPVVADVFDGFPEGVRADVVTFNPPAVSQSVSDDPDIVRNVCAGAPVIDAFFTQIAERDLLAPGGAVYFVASNTADLRHIVGHALDTGFTPHVHHLHDWEDGVLTYLFRFTRENARSTREDAR
ncbi:class I SAM-dependent methyltransferase [Nocardiopsis aegyptia]|uniref:Release factor glutamine methyltransferase n=1 Tax=Nocardiopsis aegyptia TaxID=220378 RepID=A0A7Z0J8N1_9ACTN|nr:methyltransferase [Nocardiopsis aegyptia]NYJ32445.1 release factor glutamine methyltransferase [Nocardiopsis aegyptia]